MSKFFKGRGKKATEAIAETAPREMSAIIAEYTQLKGQAGEVQYQVYALNKNLEQINYQLLTLNNEGAARQKLDGAAKPAQEGQANV